MPTLAKRMQEWGRRHTREWTRKMAGKSDVVETIQQEAKKAGATLKSGGEGGLDPELALKVFRRDKWRCSIPNCKAPQKNLDLDHIGGHPKEIKEAVASGEDVSPLVKAGAAKGHTDTMDDLHVICESHHNAVHARERAIEGGKTPKPLGPTGSKDDRKDY